MNQLAEWGRRIDGWLGRRPACVVFLVALGGLYCWAYARHPLNPGDAPPAERVGWWNWADQYKYVRATEALASGSVTREVYHYPLGYSALGVPFVRWWPAHPFFVPDLLLVLGSAVMWWRLARRWLPATAALAVAAAFVASHGELLGLTMIVPWNTLPTQFTLLAGLWLMLATQGARTVWWLAGLTAATWLVRPADALCFGPMLAWAVWRLPAWRERVAVGAGGAAVIAAAVAAVGALNIAVFGSWRTPYEQAAHTMVGFFSYPTDLKLFWTFVDGRPFFGEEDTALLRRFPWLLAAVPGMVFLVRREGAAGAAALGALGLNWILYLGYNDFFPSSLFRFTLIHYVAWSFLPLAACAAGACWSGWKSRAVLGGWFAAAVLLVLAGGLQLEERPLPAAVEPGAVRAMPASRPLWVKFPGEPVEQVTALRLDGRPMREGADFQIPYVPGELRLLLGSRAQGRRLDAAPESGLTSVPQVGDYRWAWRWDWARRSR